jgi:hypothetical protein
MKTKIYSLSHPITKEIRYIGKTTKKLKRRLIEHISTGKKNIKNHKESWICNICKNNLKPEIELIEEVESNEWEFWEKFWICQFKCWGFNLVNGTDGGISPFETFKIKELNKKFISKIKSKKVIQYDLKGNFIKIWDNITKACENVYKNDELETIREQFICEYCKDEKYYKCEQCEELFIKEEVKYGPDNQICCSETCADKFTEQL